MKVKFKLYSGWYLYIKVGFLVIVVYCTSGSFIPEVWKGDQSPLAIPSGEK